MTSEHGSGIEAKFENPLRSKSGLSLSQSLIFKVILPPRQHRGLRYLSIFTTLTVGSIARIRRSAISTFGVPDGTVLNQHCQGAGEVVLLLCRVRRGMKRADPPQAHDPILVRWTKHFSTSFGACSVILCTGQTTCQVRLLSLDPTQILFLLLLRLCAC